MHFQSYPPLEAKEIPTFEKRIKASCVSLTRDEADSRRRILAQLVDSGNISIDTIGEIVSAVGQDEGWGSGRINQERGAFNRQYMNTSMEGRMRLGENNRRNILTDEERVADIALYGAPHRQSSQKSKALQLFNTALQEHAAISGDEGEIYVRALSILNSAESKNTPLYNPAQLIIKSRAFYPGEDSEEARNLANLWNDVRRQIEPSADTRYHVSASRPARTGR